MANLFDNPKIFAFDADPESIAAFKRVIGNDARIVLVEKAVSNVNGEIDWYLSDRPKSHDDMSKYALPMSSSTVAPANHYKIFPDITFVKAEFSVPSIRLDDWWEQNNGYGGIMTIDLAWVDVNGAEQRLLEGAANTFAKHVRYIHIEFSDRQLYKDQITKAQILNMLPTYQELGIYNFKGNFGNLLLGRKDER